MLLARVPAVLLHIFAQAVPFRLLDMCLISPPNGLIRFEYAVLFLQHRKLRFANTFSTFFMSLVIHQQLLTSWGWSRSGLEVPKRIYPKRSMEFFTRHVAMFQDFII